MVVSRNCRSVSAAASRSRCPSLMSSCAMVSLREQSPSENESGDCGYDFLPFAAFTGTAVTGCVRFNHHCCAMPTMLLVRIYTAKPLEIGEIMKIPAMVTGMIFIIICCCGSVEVMGVTGGKVGDPAEPAGMAHLDGVAQSIVQAEPDGHLQEHLETAAGGVDSLATVDRHHFFVHFRFARVVQLVFFVALLDGFNFRADALHLHGGFVAGDAQREERHIDDQ